MHDRPDRRRGTSPHGSGCRTGGTRRAAHTELRPGDRRLPALRRSVDVQSHSQARRGGLPGPAPSDVRPRRPRHRPRLRRRWTERAQGRARARLPVQRVRRQPEGAGRRSGRLVVGDRPARQHARPGPAARDHVHHLEPAHLGGLPARCRVAAVRRSESAHRSCARLVRMAGRATADELVDLRAATARPFRRRRHR
jgi:hypothetical protein